jgi:hypothetical protein
MPDSPGKNNCYELVKQLTSRANVSVAVALFAEDG